jgi:hypothetical protein
MFINYVDYVGDRCMVMFTLGQVARMTACLERPRASICGVIAARQPASSSPVVGWGENRLDTFVIGTDRVLYHKWWNGTAWGPSFTGYERMGGIITRF